MNKYEEAVKSADASLDQHAIKAAEWEGMIPRQELPTEVLTREDYLDRERAESEGMFDKS